MLLFLGDVFIFTSIIPSHFNKRLDIFRPDLPLADFDGAKVFLFDQDPDPIGAEAKFFRNLRDGQILFKVFHGHYLNFLSNGNQTSS
jgi:hypothetical protein